MNRFIIAVAVTAVALGSRGVRAQEPADTFALERLIVTATRQPLPVEAVPAAVTVLDGDELRARGARLLVDALRLTPGTPVAQTGSFGGLTSLYMRGGESDYVQVLVDGVPVNQPGGAFDFGHLRTEDVERVEIVRGPVSVLYGSAAVTGVIHVITRKGTGRPTVSGSVSGGRSNRVGAEADGAFGTLAFDAGISGATGGIDYAASAAHFATEGAYAFNNDYDNTTASARAGWANDATALRVNGRLTDSEFHYPTDGAGRVGDLNSFRTRRTLALGVSGSHTFSRRVRASIEAALHDEDTGEDDAPDSPADTLGFYAFDGTSQTVRRLVDGRVDIAVASSTLLTLGAAAEAQEGETSSRSQSAFGESVDSADYDRASRAAYAQLLLTPGAGATLTAGARADDGEYGTFVTWRSGVSLRPGEWVVRAAAGTAFKEPTFYENFARGFVIGNPALDPERSLSFEIGLERTLDEGRIRFGATAYTQRFEDLIQYTFATSRPGESNYFNLGEARARGIEASASVALLEPLRLDVAWDWLDTEVIASGDAGDLTFVEGSHLLRRPEHRLSGALHWTPAVGSVWLGITHVGARQDIDFSSPEAPGGQRVPLDPYTIVNAAAEIPVRTGESATIAGTVRIENALNARFQEIVGFPARGRALYLGVRALLGL